MNATENHLARSAAERLQRAATANDRVANFSAARASQMASVEDAYRQGRWDLVLRLAKEGSRRGSQTDLAVARALRAWGAARQLIADFEHKIGWGKTAFRGFSHLDLAELPESPGRVLRRLGRELASRADVDPASASFLANVVRGDTDAASWIEIARAEDRHFALAVGRIEKRRQIRHARAKPALATLARTSAEAYRLGRWDEVLRLSDEGPQGRRASALARRDWRLSRRLMERFAVAFGWPDNEFHGFRHLDTRQLPDPPASSSGAASLSAMDQAPQSDTTAIVRDTDEAALRALSIALAIRANHQLNHQPAASAVDRNIVAPARDTRAVPLESRVVRALLGSGAIKEARRAAHSATAGLSEGATSGLISEIGKWARSAGRYDLAITLLREVAYADLGGGNALLAFVQLLFEIVLTRSLMTRLLEALLYPSDDYRGFSQGFVEESALRRHILDLHQYLATNPPPIGVAAHAGLLLPSALPDFARGAEVTVDDDDDDDAARIADDLLKQSLKVPKEWLAAAIGSNERLPPRLVLAALGRRFVEIGRAPMAARQFDHALNVMDVPLGVVRAVQDRQMLIIESYRRHRVIYFNGCFYGFHARAPTPYLGPPPGRWLRCKRMIGAMLAILVPKKLYPSTMSTLHVWAVELNALFMAIRHQLAKIKSGMRPPLLSLMRVLDPMVPRARRTTRQLAHPLGRAFWPAWRLLRELAIKILRSDAVYRLRYWRSYPIYRAENLTDLLAHVDLAVASGRAKTR